MTVYRPRRGRTWRYDFYWRGVRYQGSTGQMRAEDARAWERQYRVTLARAAGQLPVRAADTPRFSAWAQVYVAYLRTVKARKASYIDQVVRYLRLALAFWGAVPTKRPPVVGGVYHDLRLGDPIETPAWLAQFETWLAGRSVHGSHRNHYLDVLNGLYRVALLPQYRAQAGVTSNPFLVLPRHPVPRRTATLTPAQLRAWMAHAAPHVQLALAVGALAPKLRLANVLALRWEVHLDPGLQWMTVTDHKTDCRGPLVVPIVPALRRLLERHRQRTGPVIAWRGRPVASVKRGLIAAAARAGVPYGRATGVTYHTLRHTAATLLAELGLSDAQRQAALGHREPRTTQRYTHLRPTHERDALRRLAAKLAVEVSGEVLGPAPAPSRNSAPNATNANRSAGKGREGKR